MHPKSTDMFLKVLKVRFLLLVCLLDYLIIPIFFRQSLCANSVE